MKSSATLPRSSSRIARALFLIALFTISTGAMVLDNSPAVLPFSQNWSNTGMITVNDDWTAVPSIIGYRGDGLTGVAGTDPQTLLADDLVPVVDVNANQTNPNTFTTGGVAEFEITDPTIALTGSGTADAPYLLLHLNTSGLVNIHVAYNVRDIESSADDAIQQVALHFRAGPTGSYTNVPAGYVADATTGGSATQVTPISAVLPGTANNQPDLRVRIMTTNAAGNDEWVGIDDISVTGDPDSDGDGLADAVDGCPFDPLDACNLIPSGFDCFTTGCGATSTDFSETPIPAGFFDPGSEPFDGRVILGGGTLGGTDTRVQRLGDGHLLGPIPSTDVIPIELIQLNLVSCQPITVGYCGGGVTETWNVGVDLSPTPAPPGQMMVTKTHANGGFFTSQFFVQPRFTFTRVGDGAVRVLDTGLFGLPPIVMSSTEPAPWVHQASIPMNPPPCGGNFVPGVQEANAPPTPGSSCTSTTQCVKPVGHAGPGHMHVTGHIAAPCPCGACADPVNGSCVELSGVDPAAACASGGGVFKGIGTSCNDLDGDLIPDAYETNGRCVGTACDSPTITSSPTDPTRADTDGDGLSDNLDPEPVNRCMPLSAPNRPAVCDAFDQTLPGDGDADDDGSCDLCEIMNGGSLDCNINGVPDENEVLDCLGVPGGPALPGTSCNDGDPCTSGETWSAGCVCQGGTPMICDDGDPCTTDTCIPGACIAPDNGGTADMPVAACAYHSETDLHIVDGLPSGTTIEIPSIMQGFTCGGGGGGGGVCSFSSPTCTQGSPSTGEQSCRSAVMHMQMLGTGTLGGFTRTIDLPVDVEMHFYPRLPGTPVQDFNGDLYRMFGQIVNPGSGDPDFDLLRIVGGGDFGLPSPGHTTLTQLPGGDWIADSFFDITYRIDFVGKSGGPLGGMSGSTTGTIRMSIPSVPTCTHVPVNCDDGDACTTDICLVPGACLAPDNGAGSADLPDPNCSYTSEGFLHIVDGLQPGDEIRIPSVNDQFACPLGVIPVCSFAAPIPGTDCAEAGGLLGGDKSCSASMLHMQMQGTGTLAGFTRNIDLPISSEMHFAPRPPGPVQSFDAVLFRLYGQITGDPDFDLLRITAGNDFGLPSPGHTTLVQQGGNWAVESFFDITYRIDFVGHPGGSLSGMSGSTTGTIRMSTPVGPGPAICGHLPINCDDGDPCTLDICDPLLGCLHLPIICDDGDPCTTDACDPMLGCVFTPIVCDDGDPCTTDACVSGICVFTPMDCTSPDPCMVGACVNGLCEYTPICDDGDPCSQNVCLFGVCSYIFPDCDDGNACTIDGLDANCTCTHAPIACNDGDPCTTDTCDPLLGCVFTPIVCDDGDPCTTDTCDPLLGCVFTPIVCDDGDPCTTDTCDPLLGCVFTPIVCDDGDPCTTDTCDPLLGCVFTPVVCDDGDPCTTDTCDPLLGCVFTPIVCDDGDPCTTDTCDPLLGCVFTPIVCDDGDPCTTDTCDPLLGCVFTPIVCDDGDPCTTDTCDPLLGCVFTPIVCDDGDPCTTDTCDPLLGCVFTPIVCDDGDPCNGVETCVGGICQPGVMPDADGDGVCDPDDICPGGDDNIDPDIDGVPTFCDNCPDDHNPGQEDADMDGIGDVCDVACTDNLVELTLNTDANGGQTSWEIVVRNTLTVVCSGPATPPYADNAVIVETCCLPDGCYELLVYDSFGDGMTSGSYMLRDANADRIIDAASGSFGFTSTIGSNLGFCLSLGTDELMAASCDVLTATLNTSLRAVVNPAVSAEYGVSNSTSGYQFWVFEPHGSYNRRIFLSHAVPGPGAPYATPPQEKASWFKLSSMNNAPAIPQGVLLNVRLRSRVNGLYAEFGPACKLLIPVPVCQTTQLTTTANPVISCGATNVAVPGGTIHANAVAGANKYQFRFTAPGYVRNAASATRSLTIGNWATNPLGCGITYDVKVRASLDNGVTWCPYGATCQITTAACPPVEGASLHALVTTAATPVLDLWPNPNRGDHVMIDLRGFDGSLTSAEIQFTDAQGRTVIRRMLDLENGSAHATLELNEHMAPGLFLVLVTGGDVRIMERLMIE